MARGPNDGVGSARSNLKLPLKVVGAIPVGIRIPLKPATSDLIPLKPASEYDPLSLEIAARILHSTSHLAVG